MKEGDKTDTFIILKGTDFISAANRIVSMKKDDFKKLYEKEIQNVPNEIKKPAKAKPKKAAGGLIKKSKSVEADDYEDTPEINEPDYFSELRTESENEALSGHTERSHVSPSRDQSDSRIDSEAFRGWSESDRIAPRIIEPDSKKSGRADESTFSNPQLVIASAKIKIHLNQSAKFHNISHVRPITPEYIQEIKERVKSYRKDDKEYFSGIYKNLKEQNREIYKYNKLIDHDVIALIIDAIMRLLFGVSIRQGKAMPGPITYPRFESPVDKDTFDSMSKQDKKSIVFLTFVKLRASYTKHDNFMKKFEMDGRYPSFQAFLQSFAGDYMADEIINMYPAQYIKELEKSENEMDREVAIELKKIMKNESSDYPYSHEDLKICIEAIASEIHHNISPKREADQIKDVANKQAQEWEKAIELNEIMEKWTRTPDVDFVPEDIVDAPILGPR